jgi:hypothetical protein
LTFSPALNSLAAPQAATPPVRATEQVMARTAWRARVMVYS